MELSAEAEAEKKRKAQEEERKRLLELRAKKAQDGVCFWIIFSCGLNMNHSFTQVLTLEMLTFDSFFSFGNIFCI